MERCRALIVGAEEDFGIAAVEAMAAGAPVIAFGRGGVTETVTDGHTGVLFGTQRPRRRSPRSGGSRGGSIPPRARRPPPPVRPGAVRGRDGNRGRDVLGGMRRAS